MRNLKKILSLALALVMVFSLVTFASAKDFSDADAIEHTEAVEVLTALEVIDGVGNNTFNPAGKVTRAQMAKMITLISLGNVSVDAFKGTTTDLTDINGHWAEAYIKYCYSQGIISGKGSGRFDPDANVTTAEAAKMLLVAIGYNSDVQVYEGPNWNINVIRDAQINDIFDELSLANDLQINRDQAAQMMYNALNTGVIDKSSSVSRVDGSIIDEYTKSKTDTLLGNSFKGQIWVGTFTGNEKSGATSLKSGICVNGHIENASALNLPTNDRPASFVYDFDIANIGEEVKVIFKDGNSGTKNVPDKDDTIYGVYRTGSTSVVNATRNDVKNGADAPDATNKVKIGSTEYKINSNVGSGKDNDSFTIQVNFNGSYNAGPNSQTLNSIAAVKTAIGNLKQSQSGDTVKLVFNDNDEIISVYVIHTEISYVTSITSDKITLNGVGTIEIDDNAIYDGAAKNDIVTYTKYYENDKDDAYFVVEKAESVTGTLTSFKQDKDSNWESITLDGNVYKIADKPNLTLPNKTIDGEGTVTAFTSNDIDESFTAYLVNGYVGYVLRSSDSANNYALVTDVEDGGKLDSTFKAPKVELLLADGTKVAATVNKDSTLFEDGDKAVANWNSGNKLTSAGVIQSALSAGQIVRYSVNTAGEYKLIEVKKDQTTEGYQQVYAAASGSTKVYDDDLKSFQNIPTASGCVLFVNNTDAGKYQVYDIRSLKDVTVDDTTTIGYMLKDGKVVAAYVTLNGRPSGAGSNRVYGVVSSYNGIDKDTKGDTYYSWTVQYADANGEAHSHRILMNNYNGNGGVLDRDKGQLVSFEPVSDDVYNTGDVQAYNGSAYDNTNGLAVWVDEYDAKSGTLQYWTTISKNGDRLYVGGGNDIKALDDDCVISYVDMDGRKAGSPVDINEYNDTNGYRNALIVKDDNTAKIVAIFVESSGEKDIRRVNPDTLVSNPAPTVTVPAGNATVTGTGGAANYKVAAKANPSNNDEVQVTVIFDSEGPSTEVQTVTVPVTVANPSRAAASEGVNNLTFTFPIGSKKNDSQTKTLTGVTGKVVTIGESTAVKGEPAPDVAVTGYTLSKNAVTLTTAGATDTVTVSAITPENATSKTVTATSADADKVTATVEGTTITIAAKAGLTATANGTVNVTVKVGNAVPKTIAVTINIAKTEQELPAETKTALSTADQKITVDEGKFFSPDNANIDWNSVSNTLTVEGEVKGTDTAKVARPVAKTTESATMTIAAPDPAVVMSKGSVSGFSSQSFEDQLKGKQSTSLAIYRIALDYTDVTADTSKVQVGDGEWKTIDSDMALDLIVGNKTTSVTIKISKAGNETADYTITFTVSDWTSAS